MNEYINPEKQQIASEWFRQLRDQICQGLEQLESEHNPAATCKFERKPWQREGGGGGEISLLRGQLFEKAGVNISTVHGKLSEEFAAQIPGAETNPEFFATGISLVIHPLSPKVPIIHMNTRFINTSKAWFGGGIDLTPVIPAQSETAYFHQQLKNVCDQFDQQYYPRFSKWCDEYFYIKHRKEPRGVGGIFYDYINTGSWEHDFGFTKAVGSKFIEVYSAIVRNKMKEAWTKQDEEAQNLKRAKYTEFNLVYDRGTKFGLMTDGNVEAIFVSLPPRTGW